MQELGHISAFLPIALVLGFYGAVALIAYRMLRRLLRQATRPEQ